MELKKFKFGAGPMSPELIDICIEFSKSYSMPFMFIASRNQVDKDSGYVFNTKEFVNRVRSNINYNSNEILICRDHCGPYFSDMDQNKNINDAVDSCLDTISEDIKNGFDLIHVDVGRINDTKLQYKVAEQLINHAVGLNPNILLEFGSEDNNGQLDVDLQVLDRTIDFSKNFNNIRFIVSQTGSLTKQNQIGSFNISQVKKLCDVAHCAGFLFKEHNADYLNEQELIKRRTAGVDAINIAPELGCLQTNLLLKNKDNYINEFNHFYDYVLTKDTWKKWIVGPVSDDTKFIVSGHYYYYTEQGKTLLDAAKRQNFIEILKSSVLQLLSKYHKGLYL